MYWHCLECSKLFEDPTLDDEYSDSIKEGRLQELLDAVICVECATDTVSLSSTTYLNDEQGQ